MRQTQKKFLAAALQTEAPLYVEQLAFGHGDVTELLQALKDYQSGTTIFLVVNRPLRNVQVLCKEVHALPAPSNLHVVLVGEAVSGSDPSALRVLKEVCGPSLFLLGR